ncbi:hypothetical protein S4A8_07870 [Salinisphaera sp. S4-8]|uniref:DUF945 family protein n=1 Tax=Salinisphaera sp. S4-8 TaxID=633357 RepID=UPI003340E8EF
MIRKTLFWGVLTLIGLAVAAPALVGFYLEREFDDMVARLARPGLTQVTHAHFERGWFSSHATIRVELAAPICSAPPCVGTTLDTTVYHGPLPFGAPPENSEGFEPGLGVGVTRIDAASLWPRHVFEPSLAPLRVITRVGFDGLARSHLHFDGRALDIARDRVVAHIETAPISAHARIPLAGGPIALDMASPQFEIVGADGGQLAWRELEARLGAAGEGGSLRAHSLRIADGLGQSALLQSLAWQWQMLPSAPARISARVDGRIARAVINNNAYGPLWVEAETADLDIRAWRALFAQLGLLRDIETGKLDDSARATLYRETLPALLAGAPRIDVPRLQLTTPQGDVRLKLHIQAPQTMREARLLADVVSQLDMNFEARLPAGLARDLTVQVMLASGRSPYAIEERDIDQALAELVQQNLIESVDDGVAYRLRLTIEAGRLTLNGRNQIGWKAMIDQFEAARERL